MPAVFSSQPSLNPSRSLTRRAFLGLAWKALLALGGLLGLVGVARFLTHQPEPELPSTYDLGLPDDYPPGSRTAIPEAQAVVAHGAAGLLAYSLVCPHLGCLVEPWEEGFRCPCHGSKFNQRGEVVHGPADQPLRSLRLEIAANGHLILHMQNDR